MERWFIVPLFIDGHNVIGAAAHFMPELDLNRNEESRDRLIGLLARYRMVKHDRILLFFDGGYGAAHLPRRSMERGVDILYSEADSDADSDIKNMVSHDGNPRAIRVVTSDIAIQRFVRRYGARVIDSGEFMRELQQTLEESSVPHDEPIEKYEGASSQDEIDYWLNVFGEQKEEEEDN